MRALLNKGWLNSLRMTPLCQSKDIALELARYLYRPLVDIVRIRGVYLDILQRLECQAGRVAGVHFFR